MSTSSDQAFKFEHSRPDVNAQGGRRVTSYLVLAVSLDEAYDILGDLVGIPREAILVKKGMSVLAEAELLDMQFGTVHQIS